MRGFLSPPQKFLSEELLDGNQPKPRQGSQKTKQRKGKMSNYKIVCEDLEEFVKVTAGLVREGICFRGDAHRLVIVMTGGF